MSESIWKDSSLPVCKHGRYLDMPEFDVSFASDGDIVTSRVTAADYQDAVNQIYDKYNGECQVIDVRIVE